MDSQDGKGCEKTELHGKIITHWMDKIEQLLDHHCVPLNEKRSSKAKCGRSAVERTALIKHPIPKLTVCVT